MRIMTLFILILAIMGILINFIPEMFFYFKVVTHMKYYGEFSDGLWLFYAGTYSPNEATYSYGFLINITKLNASYYLVQSKLYLLSGNNSFSGALLPSFPFKASSIKEVDNYSAILNINNSTFLQILFPQNNTVKTSALNFSISPNNKVVHEGPEPKFLGCPGGYYLAKTSDPNIFYDIYVPYGSQYVLTGLAIPLNISSTKFFASMFPNYSLNESLKTQPGSLLIVLGHGNGIPAQNWLTWFEYEFFWFRFPLNVILLVSAGVLAIYDYRKTH